MEAILFLIFSAYALAQLYASFLGFEHYVGWFGALVVIVGCGAIRFSLPLTIAAFLCAKNIWGWHWFGAAVFAAPGLVFLIPSIIAYCMDLIGEALNRPRSTISITIEHQESGEFPAPRNSGVWLIGSIAIIGIIGFVFVKERSREDAPSASEFSTDEALTTPLTPIIEPEPTTPPPIAALSDLTIQNAAKEFDRVLTSSGLFGAVDYSKGCHEQLVKSRNVTDFDFCAAFDLAAAYIDEGMTRVAPVTAEPYFLEVSSDQSLMASAGLVSLDSAANRERIQQIRARVPRAIGTIILSRVNSRRTAVENGTDPDTETPEAVNVADENWSSETL